MDELRRLRYTFPPLYFVAALVMGYYLDGVRNGTSHSLAQSLTNIAKEIVPAGALAPERTVISEALIGVLGGVGLLALGYFIGTVTIVLLRMFWGDYEGVLPAHLKVKAAQSLGISPPDAVNPAVLAAVIDHSNLVDGLRGWIDRRWNAFNLSAHSGTALLLALIWVRSHWEPGATWSFVVVVGIVVFWANAVAAWRNTRDMNGLLVMTGETVRTRDETSSSRKRPRAENDAQPPRPSAVHEPGPTLSRGEGHSES